MNIIETSRLTHRYGRVQALDAVDLQVRDGSLYALLGPNGAGKTTLLKILMGLQRATSGRASVMAKDVAHLSATDRVGIGYVAEGQELPKWMRLEQLEAYLAPLYPTWDGALAGDLRRRFRLDGQRKIGTLSRGEQMKAALLCALAPRPRVLLMDEPFTGMDALVKDELVRGLLETGSQEGWTVLISSHDLSELEMLADWAGFLHNGRMLLSEPMEMLQDRFKHVEVSGVDATRSLSTLAPADALSVERAGTRMRFLLPRSDAALEGELKQRFPGATRIDVRPASLREIFVGLARDAVPQEVVQ